MGKRRAQDRDATAAARRRRPRVAGVLLALLTAAIALGVVFALQSWSGAAPEAVPSLGVVARLPSGPTARGLRVDMVVHVDPGLLSCGRADVSMTISGTRRFFTGHPALARRAIELAVAWDDRTRPTVDGEVRAPPMALNPDPQAPLHPSLYSEADLRPFALRTRAYVREGAPRASVARIDRWGATGRVKPVQLHFSADWLRRRSVDSCYVALPSLPANGALSGEIRAVNALGSDIVSASPAAPGTGRVALETPDEVETSLATPAPDDTQATYVPGPGSAAAKVAGARRGEGVRQTPVWTCAPRLDLSYIGERDVRALPGADAFRGEACDVVAVVREPAVSQAVTFLLLVLAVLSGTALTAAGKRLAAYVRSLRDG